MGTIVYHVNAFTDIPYGGKSAIVVPDSSGFSEKEIQKIVKIANAEKISFINKIDNENFSVRFFKQGKEVNFCGHTTIANFYTLANKGYIESIENGKIRVYQHVKIGKNPIDIIYKNYEVEKVNMYKDSPILLKKYGKYKLEVVKEILGIESDKIGHIDKNVYPEIIYSGIMNIIIPVKDRETLLKAKPDFGKLTKYLNEKQMKVEDTPLINLFYMDKDEQIESRQFEVLKDHIIEKACSGVASAATAFYLTRNKLIDKDTVCISQGEGIDRPSEVYCALSTEDKNYPIKIGGKATIFIEGVLKF